MEIRSAVEEVRPDRLQEITLKIFGRRAARISSLAVTERDGFAFLRMTFVGGTQAGRWIPRLAFKLVEELTIEFYGRYALDWVLVLYCEDLPWVEIENAMMQADAAERIAGE
jgi:hypothetical protein